MSQERILLLVVLVLLILLGSFVLLGRSARNSSASCPYCHRQRVSGKANCPFCAKPYADVARQAPPPSAGGSPAPTDARLIFVEGSHSAREFLLRGQGQTIGRAQDNSIVVDGLLVSRYHAQILFQNGQYILADQDSTNGTYVNDGRIAVHPLSPGDRIQIGPAVFVFQSSALQLQAPIRPAPAIVEAPKPNPPIASDYLGHDLKTFRITATIGFGGSSTVYKGVSLIDNSTVAIKILQDTNPFIREKFEQEGRIGLALTHPHIAHIYSYDETDSTYFIVMEYVDGGSLRFRLIHGMPAPLDFTRAVIGQTCEALAYAHSKKVVHRDVKPENILLSTHDGVKVVDFGIARLATASTKTSAGFLIGTPYYMSSDQAAGLPATPASDIYSLGVVLYEMLTGGWPFTGEPMMVIDKHLKTPPVPPRRINPAIPPEIETAVMRTLEKNPAQRYQNAMDLARALGYQPMMQIVSTPVDDMTTMPPQPNSRISSPVQPAPPRRGTTVRLVVMVTGVPTRAIKVGTGVTALGRNEINPNDPVISRQHLRVIAQGGQYWVEDEGSTNGTFVNGTRINMRTQIRPGDVIQAGQTTLRFEVS